MLVVMQAQATEEQVRAVCKKIEAHGLRPHSIPGAQRTAIGITGNQGLVEIGLEEMPGVQEVIQVSKPYKLVSRDVKQDNTVIRFSTPKGGEISIGGTELAIIAGPCSVESREQAFAIAECVHRAGVRKLVIANGHGGNVAALDLVALDLRVRLGMLAVTCSFAHLGYPDGVFSPEETTHGIHGGDIETSMMLAARPEQVRTERAQNFAPASVALEREFKWLGAGAPAGFGWMSQDLNPSGAIGDATLAKAAKGEAAIAYGAKAFVELLGEVHRFDLTRLGKGPIA